MSRGAHAAARAAHEARRTSATGRERVVALDGLRAFALLIIMGYHFGVAHLGGGFFSLDIFYVLSGYLITGLLLGEWARSARIRLGAFWARRARRLLPALCVVLVVVSLVVRFTYPAGLYPDLRMADLSALFYFSNWWQIAASGNYFVATGAVSPLTHTWSLAVEEQFYLVWPLVVLAVLHLARRWGRRRTPGGVGATPDGGVGATAAGAARRPDRGVEALLAVSVVGVVASAGEMAWLYHPGADITRLYFGTDTHAQSILVGAALACVLTLVQRHRGRTGMAPGAATRRWRSVLTVVGLAGVAGTVTLTATVSGTSALAYRGGFLLSALSAAAIVTGAVCVAGGPLATALSLRPMVWMGTVSYGAYLWHFPVSIELDSARTGLGGPGTAGRAGGRHLRPGRRQLLPGGAPGHGGRVLATAHRPRPGPGRPGRHRRGGGGRHRGPGVGGRPHGGQAASGAPGGGPRPARVGRSLRRPTGALPAARRLAGHHPVRRTGRGQRARLRRPGHRRRGVRLRLRHHARLRPGAAGDPLQLVPPVAHALRRRRRRHPSGRRRSARRAVDDHRPGGRRPDRPRG